MINMFHIRRVLIYVIVILFLSGCAQITQFHHVVGATNYEKTKSLIQKMKYAKSLESSKKYSEAAREFSLIADTKPITSFHKEAAEKSAILHIHPDNTEKDYGASLKYFNTLLELSNNKSEIDFARMHIVLLGKIMGLEKEVSKLAKHNNKLVSDSRVRAKKLADRLEKNSKLESELARVKEEITRMKKVDLFLHKNRRTTVSQ